MCPHCAIAAGLIVPVPGIASKQPPVPPRRYPQRTAGAQCDFAQIYYKLYSVNEISSPPCIIYIDVHKTTLSLVGRFGCFPGGTGRPASPPVTSGKYTQRPAVLNVVLHAHI